jgi:multiple antibiotic resistance protein
METFLLAFIPLFVAIDVFGVVPTYLALTEGLDSQRKRRLCIEATSTAFGISLLFLVGGKMLFAFLGITESDFRVGGGIVLLVLSVYDLLFAKSPSREFSSSPGAVPIGIPLIMGPAALTTIILLADAYGMAITIVSIMINMVIVWVVFSRAAAISRVLGEAGSRAVAKVAALFLTAIAVMMIRSGIAAMINATSLSQ